VHCNVTCTYLRQISGVPGQTLLRPAQESASEVQELASQCPESVSERWLLCRSAGCQLNERQKFEACLAKARADLPRLQARVAVSTFTSAEVTQRTAKQAVCRTRNLRGVLTWELRRSDSSMSLDCIDNPAALSDQYDWQGVYPRRATAAALAADELWHTYMLLTRVEAVFRNLKTD